VAEEPGSGRGGICGLTWALLFARRADGCQGPKEASRRLRFRVVTRRCQAWPVTITPPFGRAPTVGQASRKRPGSVRRRTWTAKFSGGGDVWFRRASPAPPGQCNWGGNATGRAMLTTMRFLPGRGGVGRPRPGSVHHPPADAPRPLQPGVTVEPHMRLYPYPCAMLEAPGCRRSLHRPSPRPNPPGTQKVPASKDGRQPAARVDPCRGDLQA